MKRDNKDKDTKYATASISDTQHGLSGYDCSMIAVTTDDVDGGVSGEDRQLSDVLQHIIDVIIPNEQNRDANGSVGYFITSAPDNALFGGLSKLRQEMDDDDFDAYVEAHVFIVVVRDIEPDTLFYFAALSSAEIFLYMTREKETGVMVLIVADRINGLNCYQLTDKGKLITYYNALVIQQMLPPSLFLNTRTIDTAMNMAADVPSPIDRSKMH